LKILLYNEGCAICYRMARYAWKLTRGRVAVLGMFSQEASKYREAILGLLGGDLDLYSSMPWLVDGGTVLGGVYILPAIFLESVVSILRPGSYKFKDPKPMACEPRARSRGMASRIVGSVEILYRMAAQSYRSIFTKRYRGYLGARI